MICDTQEEVNAVLGKLKITACPHCKRVGRLIRHGVLRGHDESLSQKKSVRAYRVFCSNRNRATGCGRTFSVWLANKVKRLILKADNLWEFLKQAVLCGNKMHAFRSLNSGLSDSAPYRIWKRFQKAQSAIRTALCQLSKPPDIASERPCELTLAHLETTFEHHSLDPVSAFQATLQISFV